MRRRTSDISKRLGGNDSVISMVAPSSQDEITEEPIAKPAHRVGFAIFRKETHVKYIRFFPAVIMGDYFSMSIRSAEQHNKFGGQNDFKTRLSKT